MSEHNAANRADAAGKAAAHPRRSPRRLPADSPVRAPCDEALCRRKYRKLIRTHLDRLLDKLFADFTGLHFHVTWAPLPPRKWETPTLPTGCAVCRRLGGSPLRPGCQICGPRQLEQALSVNGKGRHFTCRLGVRNYWLPIRLRNELLGMAYLQALHQSARRPRARKHLLRTDALVLSRPAFDRAARFLHLIVQHAQTASLADLRKADLTNAGHAVVALEREQARLHEALRRHLPAPPPLKRHSGPGTPADRAVQCLLDCVTRNFAQPITLQQCSAKLGMNAAYLSALFSRAVGRPFKIHLTELRMAKARDLLGDPAKSVAEVASAVGYATENRFRLAFKQANSLPPKLWRETMQTQPRPAG